MKKVWFITGSSRGLGRKITEVALGNGDFVAATALGKDDLNDVAEKYKDQVLLIELNVTDKSQIENAIEETVKHFGRIDVLVNNAGFGITGAAEAYTEGEVKSQLEVNLYGAIEITRLVIPIMRKQGDGRILQISSVGGRFGNPGLSIYHAAKFGLTGFSEAVGKEVAPLGIKVTSVEPGSMRTDWGGASMGFAKHIDGYGAYETILKRVGTDELLFIKQKEAILLLLQLVPSFKNVLFDFSEPGKIDLEGFMERNYHYNVQMQRFAYLTGRSLATFKRDFEKFFSKPPSRWLQERRLQEAYYMIKEQRKTPSDVYLDVGFEDLSHFSFVFKKKYGIPPSKL